ncbi:IclR family transcriptional regulator [Chelatococcus sp. GCM10030263]|uniref:IclR family transcriptional regulator n=1 Tax=Chelatococcus sp. GCM10030263 TaxID=3273387 RepID=UPI00360BC72A
MDSRTDRTRLMDELGTRKGGAAPEGRDRQRGIDRAIALMEALLRQRAPTRIGELARLINAPRSTAYEIVKRLVEADILDVVSDDGRVYFGRAMHLFGRAYADANPFYRRAREVLERLAAETGATTQLCALRGNKYVVVDSRDGPALFRITVDIGAEVPIPWTASGRLLLGHMTADEIRDFVPREDYRLPDGRVLSVDEFVTDVMRATEAGRCATTGLADRFTWCLAAPIRDRRNVTISTLCFVVPADTDEARREQLLDLLASAAEALSDHP